VSASEHLRGFSLKEIATTAAAEGGLLLWDRTISPIEQDLYKLALVPAVAGIIIFAVGQIILNREKAIKFIQQRLGAKSIQTPEPQQELQTIKTS